MHPPFAHSQSILLPLWAALILSACAGGPCLDNPAAQKALPQRVVRAVIVTAPDAERSGIKNWIEESFEIFRRQTGIKPVVQDWKSATWRESSRQGLLQQLADEMAQYPKPYDIAVAVYEMNPVEILGFALFGGWMGAIDDVYRRFIVVRRESPLVLVHELGHAFLFKHVHSSQAMQAFEVCAIGDQLCANSSLCFGARDRMEIMENGSRRFTDKPPLLERQDLLKGYAFCKTYLRLLFEVVTLRSRDATDKRE